MDVVFWSGHGVGAHVVCPFKTVFSPGYVPFKHGGEKVESEGPNLLLKSDQFGVLG
jgi:hypothetical protein